LEGAVALVAIQAIAAKLIAEIDVVEAVAVEVADRHAAAVVVKIDLEGLALLVGQEGHAKVEAHLRGTFAEAALGRIWPRSGIVPVARQAEPRRRRDGGDSHNGKKHFRARPHPPASSSLIAACKTNYRNVSLVRNV